MSHDEDDVYNRLGLVERQGTVLEQRVGAVEETLRGHGAKLDGILQAVSGHKPFNPVAILTFIALAVGIFSAAAAGITYIASTTHASRIAVLEYRADLIQSAGRYVVFSVAGSAHAKQALGE